MRKNSKLSLAILTLISFFFLSPAYSWYNGGKEGWWWYQDPEKEKKVEEKQKEAESLKKKPEKEERAQKEEKEEEEWKPSKPLEEYTYEELLKMPVSEFKKLLYYYRDLAVSDPTNEKNVYYYYNLLDVARKKAILFMSQTQLVMNKYPELNVRKDYPSAVPGINRRVELQRGEEERTLKEIGKSFGLVLFVREGCPYCEVQYDVLRPLFERGVPVKVVDVDKEPRAISRFNVETVPMILLVHKDSGSYVPIAVGVVSLSELYQRITTVATYLTGEKKEGQIYLYEFQKGSSFDPYTPPPLFKEKSKEVKKSEKL